MNELNGAAAMVMLLQKHGVKTVFGLCGDTSLPMYDALYRLDHGIRHVLTRDERSAGYMADVFARVSGKTGVCEGPSGGGATYMAPALIEANDSSAPIVAITSDVSVASRGRYPLTELDQEALYRPLTKWNTMLNSAAQIPHSVRRAFNMATSGKPGSVHLGFPIDVQRAQIDADDIWADPSLLAYPSRRVAPDPAAIDEAAAILAGTKRPVIVVGGGAVISSASAELAALAERIAAPVLCSVSGKGALADSHTLMAGAVGSNGGTVETREIVAGADTVIMIGCRAGSVTTERWRYPAPGSCRIIHIDIDPDVVGVTYFPDAAIIGDAKLSIAALHAAAKSAGAYALDSAKADVARAKASRRSRFEKLADSEERPIRPERLVRSLNRNLPDDAVLVLDPGTPCPYFTAYYDLAKPGRHIVTNRAHGALGYSLPGVIGAQFARPNSKCVAIMGDGSFGFSAGEMETIVRYNLPIMLVVVANSTYGWIKAGQATSFGKRYYSVDFSASQHARIAEAYGLKAWRVEDPRELDTVFRQAIATDGPTLVEVVSQPLHEAAAPVSEWIA